MPLAYAISPAARDEHEKWLLEVTQIPTAAGQEFRVIDWVRTWAAKRPDLTLAEDAAGNLTIALGRSALRADTAPSVGSESRPTQSRPTQSGPTQSGPTQGPVYFTAHLDHPAFVVERLLGPATAQLAFRGGVMDDYFKDARVVLHTRDNRRYPATLTGRAQLGCAVFKSYVADLDADAAEDLRPGDIATWELPPARIKDGLIHTHACDDLAALAAAIAAFDTLREARQAGEQVGDVRLLFTRAEEVGFVGALAACRDKSIPQGSRILALENSRSFDDSPLGGGPIVRVGDRLSIFSPALTAAVAARAEEVAGSPAQPMATQKQADLSPWRWQRKLMAGGACEATVFCAYGYEATCVCLPLGNYHNMADLAAVQAGTFQGQPRVAPEFVSLADFRGLVDLLVACGLHLPAAPDTRAKVDKLWDERRFVIGA